MSAAAETIRFTADKGDARLRLDQLLVRRVRDISRFSRTQAQHWIELGIVVVDGSTATRAAMRIQEGAQVVVTVPAGVQRRAVPQGEAATPLVLRYEDDWLMVVDKPAGMVVHPSYKQTGGTLLNGVLWRVRGRSGVTPGILTRLDKDTSGLVIVALAPQVHAALQRDASRGDVRKEYLAIVDGVPQPESGAITMALSRDPADRRRVVADARGAPSETRYAVMRSFTPAGGQGRRSLVQCQLITGRTHQIRVHLATSGWPIVGDRVYGVPDSAISRQALHAWRVALPHPVTRAPLHIESPLPEDFLSLLPAAATAPRD